ncbi:acetyl-CoA synthetase-like protein [Ramaria rubella]|nr:acetyl-CoA synthetase-like protein [Ramaria rubella]
MPRIYYSDSPDIPLPEHSIFTQTFSHDHDAQLPAYIDAPTGKTLSRADVHTQSLQLAWALKNILGQGHGDTMAIFSPNSLAWPIILLGGIAAGLRITTVNSAYTPSELQYQLHDSQAHYVFVHPSLLGTAIEALKLMKVDDAGAKKRIVLMGLIETALEGWRNVDDLLGKGRIEKEELFKGPAAHETIFLCYSSGTTSKSKGVELSHYNVTSTLCALEVRMKYLHPGGPVMLGVLPFFHIFGLTHLVLFTLYAGAPLVIMSKFNPDEFCASIDRYKVTVAVTVPPILVVLANHPAPEQHNISSLKVIMTGAAPLGKDLQLAVNARLRSLGADVMIPQGYGMTEAPICSQYETEWKAKVGSVGRLLANIQGRLVLDDDKTDAPEGEPGEMWIKGSGVMKGYFNNPAATKESITPEGWYKTGDIAIVDGEGHFKIVDRKKELIKYKGSLVPPAELEGVLLTHPNVVDAGVIGVWSDAEATESPRAYVVPRGGAASLKTAAEREKYGQEIQKWIQDKVARHKYLRGGVVVVDAIPKSAAGKILRRELRELAKKDSQVTGAVIPKL